jgi:hypothetical protein
MVVGATPAMAHEAPFGIGGFPGLMLHVLSSAELLLLYAAAALVAGRAGAGNVWRLALAFAAGILAGKGAHVLLPELQRFWHAPYLAALVCGLAVAGFGRLPIVAGLALVFVPAFVIGVGIVPHEAGDAGLATMTLAAMGAGFVLIALISWPLSRAQGRVGSIAARIAGAWLSAIALLNLALVLKTPL